MIPRVEPCLRVGEYQWLKSDRPQAAMVRDLLANQVMLHTFHKLSKSLGVRSGVESTTVWKSNQIMVVEHDRRLNQVRFGLTIATILLDATVILSS